jgi:hypothetical protein
MKTGYILAGLGVLGAVVVLAGLHRFLALDKPLASARCLIVEGWLPPLELRQCAAIAIRDQYELVIVAARKEALKADPSMTILDRARAVLIANGVAAEKIVLVGAPPTGNHRTFAAALAVRAWLKTLPATPSQANVVSGGAHARKTHAAYRRALAGMVELGSLSVRPDAYNPTWWFLSRIGVRYTLLDLVGYLYALCWPLPDDGSARPGSTHYGAGP